MLENVHFINHISTDFQAGTNDASNVAFKCRDQADV